MRKIILLVAMALSCVCWACYDNEIAGPDAGQACLISLSGEIDQVTLSRVNDGGFCHNDVMGVYIVDYEGGSPGTLLDEGNRQQIFNSRLMKSIINGIRHTMCSGRIVRLPLTCMGIIR